MPEEQKGGRYVLKKCVCSLPEMNRTPPASLVLHPVAAVVDHLKCFPRKNPADRL
jgi:hypothetical protein